MVKFVFWNVFPVDEDFISIWVPKWMVAVIFFFFKKDILLKSKENN